MSNRTVTLTARPPVRIVESDWPIVARSREAVESRNGTPLPAYECASWGLYVRQHADGRAIVYGVASAPGPGWPTHGATSWRGGRLLPAGADLAAVIADVGGMLVEEGGAPGGIVAECIADLPAETI